MRSKRRCKGSERYKGILEITGGRLVPEWLDVDQENLKGVVKELPTREADRCSCKRDAYRRAVFQIISNCLLCLQL